MSKGKVKWKRAAWYIYIELENGDHAGVEKESNEFKANVTRYFKTQREAKRWAEKVLEVE